LVNNPLWRGRPPGPGYSCDRTFEKVSVFPIQKSNSDKTYVILTAKPMVAGPGPVSSVAASVAWVHVVVKGDEDLVVEGWDLWLVSFDCS
jgi:hypothetical protein